MKERYIFRKATQQEIPAVFALIMRRVAWMDRVGIRQWNTTKYDERYPLDYYEKRRQMDELFVLEDGVTGQILCVGALFHEDERWPDPESAYYLHHLAAELDAKGAGSMFLQAAEAYTAGQGRLEAHRRSVFQYAVCRVFHGSYGVYRKCGEHCSAGVYQ